MSPSQIPSGIDLFITKVIIHLLAITQGIKQMKKTEVLQHFKSQSELARRLTAHGFPISQPAISKWPEEVPSLRAFQIQLITGGALKADRAHDQPSTSAA
ncbi:Cro/CI family transcriptional regulator [Marinobacterium sp. BA1]|uniref:Cro/CI family transcriptional regulator n=1 Tax=Marinobacterium sp. BA1 TaxID=3138931 RepID=UPI0034E8D76D